MKTTIVGGLALALAALATGLPAHASARKYCGNETVPFATGPGHIEVDVLSGNVSCHSARWAFRWAYKHPDYTHGNKYLGDPKGWRCVVARATNPAVAGDCRRRHGRGHIRAFNLDYGE